MLIYGSWRSPGPCTQPTDLIFQEWCWEKTHQNISHSSTRGLVLIMGNLSYPQGPHFVAISFSPVRLSFRLYLPSANHPADQLQIVCCLDTYTRPKGRASANRIHDSARGTRKHINSRGRLVRRCCSMAACRQPRRAVLPGLNWLLTALTYCFGVFFFLLVFQH